MVGQFGLVNATFLMLVCLLPVILMGSISLAASFGWIELKPYTDPCAEINGTLRSTAPRFVGGGLMGRVAFPANEIKYSGKHFYLCEVLTVINETYEPQLIAYNPEDKIKILAEETQK